MAGLFEFLLRKATGKRRGDIELPAESGEVDPRLPKTPEVRKALDTSFRNANEYAAGEGSPTERLRAAGRRAAARRK